MFRPMLADNKSIHTCFDKLVFPAYASYKVDGIRATVRGGVVYARSNEPLRNINIQKKFGHLENLDFELGAGDPTSDKLCRYTGGITNSIDKPVDDVKAYAFDHIGDLEIPYSLRRKNTIIAAHQHDPGSELVEVLDQVLVHDLQELLVFEDKALDLGYEGLIVRSPHAPYKPGRSTIKEGYLLKLKRFTDGEFKVVGFTERMHNGNEKTTNALGRGKRSSHQENKSGRGDLGALILEFGTTTFQCGAGFSDKERSEIWSNQTAYLGKLAKVKYFARGMKDVPRHPTFLSWRDRSDL